MKINWSIIGGFCLGSLATFLVLKATEFFPDNTHQGWACIVLHLLVCLITAALTVKVMNWYKLLMIMSMVLVAFTALIMGACAHAYEQYGNTLAMYSMITGGGLCMVLLVLLFKEATDD